MLEGRYVIGGKKKKEVISALTFGNPFVLRRIRACIL